MRKKKPLFERACNVVGGALETRMVARKETKGRILTDLETVEECIYLLETIDYAGIEPEYIRPIKKACRYIIKAYKG